MRHARFPKLLGPDSQCEHTPSSRIAYRYSSTILMPFLKHNDPSTQVADTNDSSHKCLWVALPNAELNKQLRTCTQAFAEWVGVDPNMGFAYRDMAAWTAEVAGIAGDMDRRSYLQWYFGMQDAPGGLEEPFLLAFAHVEKRAYASEALFVTALVAGAAKADRSRLEAAALSDGGLHACQANRAADEKEVAITFGMLRGTGAGGRMVAWLVIVGEFSGEVAGACRRHFPRHVTLTVDFRRAEGGAEGLHYCGDARDLLYTRRWRLIVAHPPCRAAALSNTVDLQARVANGELWFSMAFAVLLYCAPADIAVIEQPASQLERAYRAPDTRLQFLNYGVGYSKEWCLWHRGGDFCAPPPTTPGAAASMRAPHRIVQHDRADNRGGQVVVHHAANAPAHVEHAQTALVEARVRGEADLALAHARLRERVEHSEQRGVLGRTPVKDFRRARPTDRASVGEDTGDLLVHLAAMCVWACAATHPRASLRICWLTSVGGLAAALSRAADTFLGVGGEVRGSARWVGVGVGVRLGVEVRARGRVRARARATPLSTWHLLDRLERAHHKCRHRFAFVLLGDQPEVRRVHVEVW